MTFDELIAQGILDTLDEKCAQYHTNERKHHFSFAYKVNRRRTIRAYKKRKPFTVRKLKYALLMVILLLFALVGFGIWRQHGKFSFNVFSDHSDVRIKSDNSKAKIEEVYVLPDEYELLSMESGEYDVWSTYLINGEEIVISQDKQSVEHNANTENRTTEYFTINDFDAFYIQISDNYAELTWLFDGYSFNISGNIDKNCAVNLAKSLKVKNT